MPRRKIEGLVLLAELTRSSRSSFQLISSTAWVATASQPSPNVAGKLSLQPIHLTSRANHSSSTFSNAHVEVRDDTQTGSIHINVHAPGSRGQVEAVTPDSSSESAPETPLKKNDKVSRPANAFILYRKHHHPATVAQNSGLHNNEISKIIGKMWRDESETIKKEWKDKADQVKRQHLRDHPDYQYQPRKPHEKKRRMSKRKTALALGTNPSTSWTTSSFNPSTTTSCSPFATISTPAQIVDLATIDPGFDYFANADLASFTFDTMEPGQLDLFDTLINDHNLGSEAPIPAAQMPAAGTVLPTTLNQTLYHQHNNIGSTLNIQMPTTTTSACPSSSTAAAATNTTALSDLQLGTQDLASFEDTIENLLNAELDKLKHSNDAADAALSGTEANNNNNNVASSYNDLEAQRFTEFLNQMPDDMWGMEFIN